MRNERAKRLSFRIPHSAIRIASLSLLALSLLAPRACAAERITSLERSYWVHASLGGGLVKGYWKEESPFGTAPTAVEIRNAARLLTGHYAANRIYLIYHHEIPIPDFLRVLRLWRAACPRAVDLVPTLVLRTYSRNQQELFTAAEVEQIAAQLKRQFACRAVAVFDVMPNRDQGAGLAVLRKAFPAGLIRVGLQPQETTMGPYQAFVQDDWSGLCHGKTNDDWRAPGFGGETLSKWVKARNRQSKPVAWDLVSVAWDYSVTQRGGYPGYDDAAKNMPLPAGRNRLAAALILATARPGVLRGFSSDLSILEWNSRNAKHDGAAKSFYSALKRGEIYRGYYAEPLEEIAAIYRELRAGTPPSSGQ